MRVTMRLLLIGILLCLVGAITYRLVDARGPYQDHASERSGSAIEGRQGDPAPGGTAQREAPTAAQDMEQDDAEQPVDAIQVADFDPAVGRVRRLLHDQLDGSIHAPEPIDESPHEIFLMLQGTRKERGEPVAMVYKTDPAHGKGWQGLSEGDWSDLSPLIGKGPNWVGGMWHLDYQYHRPQLLHWVNDHIAQQAADHRRLLRGLVAAVDLSSSYDPALACALNLATIRSRWASRVCSTT